MAVVAVVAQGRRRGGTITLATAFIQEANKKNGSKYVKTANPSF